MYVGRTTRAMRTRFREHGRLIEDSNTEHSAPQPFYLFHNDSAQGLKLFGIVAITVVWKIKNVQIMW